MIRLLASFIDTSGLPQTKADSGNLTNIFNIILATMGALALLMLVIAGFRYTVSQGDPTRVADSKRMIIYTIAGLLVIALAATIVNFVVGRT
ncbi:pilin [Candidatus Saccharibacteria bacterium]|nr:pilin [Candidatus Saccharibacteria bacterium]